MTSDDDEVIKLRIRGFKRFLNTIKNHPILQGSEAFINFLWNDDYETESTTVEITALENDISTVSKFFFNIYCSLISTISGSNGSMEPKNQESLDFNFNSDLQKLNSLLGFLTSLHLNSWK